MSSTAVVIRAAVVTSSTKKAEVAGWKKHCHFTEEEILLVVANLTSIDWKVVSPKVGNMTMMNQEYQKILEKTR